MTFKRLSINKNLRMQGSGYIHRKDLRHFQVNGYAKQINVGKYEYRFVLKNDPTGTVKTEEKSCKEMI